MSEAIKPTPGPCFVVGRAVHSDAVFCIGQFGHSFLNGNWSGSDFATEAHQAGNAELFADALNVFHETQCTPRQLVERVKELEEALKACAAVCAGETMSKSGLVSALEKALKVLSKSLPNTVAEVKE